MPVNKFGMDPMEEMIYFSHSPEVSLSYIEHNFVRKGEQELATKSYVDQSHIGWNFVGPHTYTLPHDVNLSFPNSTEFHEFIRITIPNVICGDLLEITSHIGIDHTFYNHIGSIMKVDVFAGPHHILQQNGKKAGVAGGDNHEDTSFSQLTSYVFPNSGGDCTCVLKIKPKTTTQMKLLQGQCGITVKHFTGNAGYKENTSGSYHPHLPVTFPRVIMNR